MKTSDLSIEDLKIISIMEFPAEVAEKEFLAMRDKIEEMDSEKLQESKGVLKQYIDGMQESLNNIRVWLNTEE